MVSFWMLFANKHILIYSSLFTMLDVYECMSVRCAAVLFSIIGSQLCHIFFFVFGKGHFGHLVAHKDKYEYTSLFFSLSLYISVAF